LKKVRTAVFAGAATLASAVPAVAQTRPLDVTVTARVKTKGKGKSTAKKPKLVTAARTGFTANAEAKETVSEMRFYLPKTLKLSGKGFPKCSVDVVAVDPSQCAPGSKIGAGTASAQTGGPNPAPLRFETDLYNGGGNKVALLVRGVGSEVGVPIEGLIKKAGLAPYGQVLTVEVPERLQQPAPLLYSYITGVDTTINGSRKSKGKTIGYAQQFGCPKNGKHQLAWRS